MMEITGEKRETNSAIARRGRESMDRKEAERKEFLKVIKENPYDESVRAIYADWLDDANEPEEADFFRRWTLEKHKEAEAWLRDLASRCGATCENYGDDHYLLHEAMSNEGLYWFRPENRARIDELREQIESTSSEKWVPITYETVIEAGHTYISQGYGWIQVGSETARDLCNKGVNEKFWECWETVTGIRVSFNKQEAAPFVCTC